MSFVLLSIQSRHSNHLYTSHKSENTLFICTTMVRATSADFVYLNVTEGVMIDVLRARTRTRKFSKNHHYLSLITFKET